MSLTERVNANKPHVLLVEDELIVQKIHYMFLKQIGCQIDTATKGIEALEKASQGYDLIFMDLGLPDLSGVEVIKVIRCYEQDNKRVPIVVLTAYVEEKIINACLAAGADSVFYKPIEPGKLAEIVWKYCH